MCESTKSPGEPLQFYTEVLVRLLRDAAASCGLSGSESMHDIDYVQRRVSNEGIGFLMKTLPLVGKSLDKALATDCETSDLLSIWQQGNFSVDKKTGLPKFLRAYWQLIFVGGTRVADLSNCAMALDRQVAAVRAVRQIGYLFYKLAVPHTKEQEEESISRFIETDSLLPSPDESRTLTPEAKRTLESARLLLSYVLKGFMPEDIRPAHGPGAVASGEKPWEKMNFSRFYPELDEAYPYTEYFFFNYTHLCDELESLEGLTVAEPTAKLSLVPKDSRGPRIISMEPLEIQWIQQGLGRALTKHLESRGCLCSGYVNFTNQMINRNLALKASIYPSPYGDGRHVTVDMKDASDRVSLWLVANLFHPHVFKYLNACRSTGTQLPSGDRLTLKKFAPMGSALCFPVEALVFWVLAVCANHAFRSYRDIEAYALSDEPRVYAYGDDLILTNSQFKVARPIFEELNLRFNEDKCCTGRFFRESCGCDAFRGVDITPTRIKALWSGPLSPAATLSYLAYENALRVKGFNSTADFIGNAVEEASGPIPFTNVPNKHMLAHVNLSWNDSSVEARNKSRFPIRYNRRWQRTELKVPQAKPRVFKRGKPGWSEMLRLHQTWGLSGPFGDENGVLQACCHTVPDSVTIGGCWIDSQEFIQ